MLLNGIQLDATPREASPRRSENELVGCVTTDAAPNSCILSSLSSYHHSLGGMPLLKKASAECLAYGVWSHESQPTRLRYILPVPDHDT